MSGDSDCACLDKDPQICLFVSEACLLSVQSLSLHLERQHNVHSFVAYVHVIQLSFSPSRIYKCDESGLPTLLTKLHNDLSDKGTKRVAKVTSAEREKTVTFVLVADVVRFMDFDVCTSVCLLILLSDTRTCAEMTVKSTLFALRLHRAFLTHCTVSLTASVAFTTCVCVDTKKKLEVVSKLLRPAIHQ